MLDVLSHYEVPATFFMIGWEAAASPDLVRRVAASGDGVGSHTWNHIDLTRLSDAGMAVQGGQDPGPAVVRDGVERFLASARRRDT
jgi:peptidoglycan/xylan/chitin deacetylase (PgdA/CDA1 family)